MHKNFIKSAILMLLALVIAPAINAQDPLVKREMRSSWVATVWQLDWPPSVVSETGNASQIQKQKDALTKMLDSLQVNNFNAINFQVRSRADAMYKSSYEPWSVDLVKTRGMDPGWDPLAFAVEECHKRGMECHAWVNPYRNESVAGDYAGPNDYRTTNPDWLIEVGGASILNPGIPEVRQRIYDVVKEIVTNYDIDGLLFDDYFYLQGISDEDAEQYSAYTAAGGTLALADWRRENVNEMIAGVYKTINDVKPWVRFGVSPAGVACTNPSVANQYGIPASSGSDWQYSGIYSDPVAWVSRQTLDFISPQVYWTIGNSTDYAKITPWWGMVANKFGRHLYVSHSISSLTSSSKAPAESGIENTKMRASGPNNNKFSEFADQIRLNRSSSQDGNFGSIFYSTKYIYNINSAESFGHYLKKTVFNGPALMPTLTWKGQYDSKLVSDVTRVGANTLTWKGHDNVRYSVYAVPTSTPIENFNWDAEYLMGVSYSTSYTIPENRQAGYNFAVCVYDRYGYEYSPSFADVPTTKLDAPTLVYPANGGIAEYPFEFSWNSVNNAISYIIEVAKDKDFKDKLYTLNSNSTTFSVLQMPNLTMGETYYWRVYSCGINALQGTSETFSFNMNRLLITSPENASIDVSLTPTMTWSMDKYDPILEISTRDDFETLIMQRQVKGGSYTIPQGTLCGNTTYYCRLFYQPNGIDMYTPAVSFTTADYVPTGVPTITYPKDGGEFFSEDHIVATPVHGCFQVTFRFDTKANVGARFYQESNTAPSWQTKNKAGDIAKLKEGTTYYIIARASYRNAEGAAKDTDWTPVISATYKGEGSGVDDIFVDSNNAPAKFYNLQGVEIAKPESGVYIRVQDGKAMKVTK